MHNCFLSSRVSVLGYSTYVVFLAIRIKPEMRHFPKIEVYKQLFTILTYGFNLKTPEFANYSNLDENHYHASNLTYLASTAN